MTDTQVQFLDRGDGLRLAFRKREGQGPTIVFLPGYASDMEGTKALALDAFASERLLPLLRLDYSVTGSSEGAFEDGEGRFGAGDFAEMTDEVDHQPSVTPDSECICLIASERPMKVTTFVGRIVHMMTGV